MSRHQRELTPTASLSVTVKDHEKFEQALRRFKRKVSDAGVIQEVRNRQYFEQPSQTRKIAKAAGRARARRRIQQSLPKKAK